MANNPPLGINEMRNENNPGFYGPYRAMHCNRCGYEHIHQCNEISNTRPQRSWVRVVMGNWWEHGWRIEIREGGVLPVGYGFSWHKVNELKMVMHPIPFNVLMRGFREVCHWIMRGGPWQIGTVQDRIDFGVAKRLELERKR